MLSKKGIFDFKLKCYFGIEILLIWEILMLYYMGIMISFIFVFKLIF